MSVLELGSGEVRELPAGVVHLVTADDVLADGEWCGVYLALCGALVPASGLPSSLCPEGCECDPYSLYCLRCVRRVVQFAAESAQIAEGEVDPRDDLDDAEVPGPVSAAQGDGSEPAP